MALSRAIFIRVRNPFNEYDITTVANVEAVRNICVINFENLKHLILVRFEMESWKKYKLNKIQMQ